MAVVTVSSRMRLHLIVLQRHPDQHVNGHSESSSAYCPRTGAACTIERTVAASPLRASGRSIEGKQTAAFGGRLLVK